MQSLHIENHDDHATDAMRYFFVSMDRRTRIKRERLLRMITRIALLAAIFIIAIVWTAAVVRAFFDTYAIHLHLPVTIDRIEKHPTGDPQPQPLPGPAPIPMPVPTPTKPTEKVKAAEAKVTPDPHRIAYFIWTKETGRGNAHSGWQKTCEDQGKWNEIGYGGDGYCFESEAEGMATLTRELTARIAKNGLKETLCVYNKGFNRNEAGERIPWADCSYYQSYINSL